MKNILIVDDDDDDDDLDTSLRYKKWLKEEGLKEGFNLTLINDLGFVEQNFRSQVYDLVLIGFRMFIMDGFDLYKS